MVTMEPFMSIMPSSLGIASISLDFSDVATWPSSNPCSLAHALTICNGLLPLRRLCEPHDVLPSIDIISFSGVVIDDNDFAHSTKHSSNFFESRIAKTLASVSCDGMPCGSSRNSPSHSSLLPAKLLSSTQLSAPQIVPNIVIVNISDNL